MTQFCLWGTERNRQVLSHSPAIHFHVNKDCCGEPLASALFCNKGVLLTVANGGWYLQIVLEKIHKLSEFPYTNVKILTK